MSLISNESTLHGAAVGISDGLHAPQRGTPKPWPSDKESFWDLVNTFFIFTVAVMRKVIILTRSEDLEILLPLFTVITFPLVCYNSLQGSVLRGPAMHSQGDESTICGEDRGRRKVHIQSWTEHSG